MSTDTTDWEVEARASRPLVNEGWLLGQEFDNYVTRT